MTSPSTSTDFPDRRQVGNRGAGQEMQVGRCFRPEGNQQGETR
jgi:hypothetical protein